MKCSDSTLTIVLTNWSRPQNIAHIAQAFRSQLDNPFRKTEVWLVDNAVVAYEGVSAFDNVVRMQQNAGPCCRFAALPMITKGAVLFYDDDALPSLKSISALASQADKLQWDFASIGEIGRYAKTCRMGGWRLRPGNARRGPTARPVDVLCRAHFFDAANSWGPLRLRSMVAAQHTGDDLFRHDDIFLSLGLQLVTGKPSFLMEKSYHRKLFVKNLPSACAQSARPGHRASRSVLISVCHKIGWRPKR